MTGFFSTKKKRKGASPSMKEEILLRQGSKCKKCPTKFSLKVRPHIDHKDGDRSNNKPSNLQALCPNCHDQKSRRETKRRSNPKNQSVMISVWVSLAPMNPRKEKRSLLTHMPIPLAT